MTRTELEELVATFKAQTKEALQTLWDNINKGQRKQLYKIESIKHLLDTYGVEVED